MDTVDFAMSGGIFESVCEIMTLRNDSPLIIIWSFGDKHTPDRNLIAFEGFFRLFKCKFHEFMHLILGESIFIYILHLS